MADVDEAVATMVVEFFTTDVDEAVVSWLENSS